MAEIETDLATWPALGSGEGSEKDDEANRRVNAPPSPSSKVVRSQLILH